MDQIIFWYPGLMLRFNTTTNAAWGNITLPGTTTYLYDATTTDRLVDVDNNPLTGVN